MSLKLKSLFAASSSLLVCALAGTAHAQTQGTIGNGEIVVTANKRAENINDVGLTITAITGNVLSERRVTSVEDIANTVPGLSFAPSATNTPILTLRGVGFNENSLGVYPAVTVYIDQAPLAFPVLTAHSAFDLERVEVLKGPQGTLFGQNSTGGAINYIAKRPTDFLEVGGDITYGRFNTIEGNAHISGPIADGLRGRVAVTGANSDGWQRSTSRQGDKNGAQSYIAGRFLLDWDATSALRFQLNVNGWRDKSEPQAQQSIARHEAVTTDPSQPPQTAPAIDDPLRNAYTPPYIPGAPSANLSYPYTKLSPRNADWSTQWLDPSTSTVQNAGGSSDPAAASVNEFTPRANRRMWQAFLRGDLDVTSDITLTSLTSYVDYKQDQVIDSDGMAIVAYDFTSSDGTVKSFNQELRLANSVNNSFRWILGANYEKSKTFEDLEIRYFANGNYFANNFYINSSGDRLRQNIRNIAAFGNFEYDLTPELTLKAAARYTNSRIRARNGSYTRTNGNVNALFNVLGSLSGLPFDPIGPDQSYTLNSLQLDVDLPSGLTIYSPIDPGAFAGIPGIPFQAKLKEDNVSWRLGLDYDVTPDVLLYANVSRGYKAGSFPTVAAASYTSMLPVTQEKVTAYEAGVKASLFDRKVQFNAAGFYMDYRDKQVRGKLFDFIFGTIDLLVNVPKSRIWGGEADVTVRPVDGLTLTGAVTYLNTKITSYTGFDIFGGVDNPDYTPGTPNVEDLSGNPLPYTPKWSGVIDVDYRFEALGGKPFIGVTVSAKSKQDAAIGGGTATLPTGPRYSIHPDVGPHPYTVDGYATVDARLGFEAGDESWRIMFWGKNIFDKYYWTAVIPSSDQTGRLAGRPATYGVTLGFKM
ncbi:MAG: TonB-dependent receptor [Novosphingobium sp.]|nr:TonB-dependent receptor [Novosphingobium sp.]